jgi:EAL domain-containing protein (putative c-di-GMP-specific phosphodiesterase class I)
MTPASGLPPSRILIVDDDRAVLRALTRFLDNAGYDSETATCAEAAMDVLALRRFDTVMSDIHLPGMTGLDLLRAVRLHDPDVPVIIMTGAPEIETAMKALEQGALRYLVKPIVPADLTPIVSYAVQMCRMARTKREALLLLGDPEKFIGDRASISASFSRALDGLWMAYQPIVCWSTKTVYAHEALLRSREPSLSNPGAILSAGERLGRLNDLGRAIRHAVADTAATARGSMLFVNLHTLDLIDDSLFALDAPLTQFASDVTLEITERSALDLVTDVSSRVEELRRMGYRLAVDDLGAGYAGLTSFALLRPDVVKLDMSLVRGVDANPIKQKLVGTMAGLASEMGMRVVVEGVETIAERDTLIELGCDLFQGYLFARPTAEFPPISW